MTTPRVRHYLRLTLLSLASAALGYGLTVCFFVASQVLTPLEIAMLSATSLTLGYLVPLPTSVRPQIETETP